MGVQSVESGTVGVSHGYFFPQPGPFFLLFSWRDLLTQGNETGQQQFAYIRQSTSSLTQYTNIQPWYVLAFYRTHIRGLKNGCCCSLHPNMAHGGGIGSSAGLEEKPVACVASSTALAIRNSTIIAHRLSIYLPQLLLPSRDPQKVCYAFQPD